MSYDFNFITERLCVGANINSSFDVDTIKATGITHVIDANTDDEQALFGRSIGVMLLSDPTNDDGQPKPTSWFEAAIDWGMNDALSSPRHIVLCHCAAGINRGPSLAYAIMRAQGWTAPAAFNQLVSQRPAVNAAYRNSAERALLELGWITSFTQYRWSGNVI